MDKDKDFSGSPISSSADLDSAKEKGLLDNLVQTLRSGVEELRHKGEELTQSARLRLDIVQRTRELDTLYARLGRSFHSGAAPEVLEVIQQEIRDIDRDITAKEALLRDLGEDPHPDAIRLDEIRIQQVRPVQELAPTQTVSDGVQTSVIPSDVTPIRSGDAATFTTRTSANVTAQPEPASDSSKDPA